MGIGAGGAAAQSEAGHDAFVGEEEQSGKAEGEEAGARLTTSWLFAAGKPVSRRRSSKSKYCLGWSACIHPMHQAARGSGVWPVSRSVRFAAAARLPGRGYFTVEWAEAGSRAEQSRADRAGRCINNLAAKAPFLPLNLSTFLFSPSSSQCGNIVRCGIREQSCFAGKGAPKSNGNELVRDIFAAAMLVVSRVRLEVSPLWTLSGHNAHKSIEQLHPSLLAVLRLQASSMLSHCSPTGTVPDSVQSCCMKVYSRSAAASTRLHRLIQLAERARATRCSCGSSRRS